MIHHTPIRPVFADFSGPQRVERDLLGAQASKSAAGGQASAMTGTMPNSEMVPTWTIKNDLTRR
jgi:hypothetical protein